MLRVHPLVGNRQRLDGGAMFGNAPRALWSRWLAPDESGRVELACRAVLVDDGQRRILLETGIGAFFEPKLRERYGVVEREHVLLASLARAGFSDSDVDVVVLSHLHFDHAGGLLAAHEPGAPLRLLFPKATFVTSRAAFERSRKPHPRDRASFIEGLAELLLASSRLVLVEDGQERAGVLGDRFELSQTAGHTPGLLHTSIRGASTSMFYCTDLVPGVAWVRLPVTMGYDRFPELLVDEKRARFEQLVNDRTWLAFVHDPAVAFARLERDGEGFRTGTTRTDELGALDLDLPD